MIAKILNGIDTLSKAGAYLSSLCMMAIVALITTEIVMRTFFKTSTYVSSEYSGYLMVAVVMAGFSYTLQSDAHIRITVVLIKLPPMLRKAVEIAAIVVAILITGFICNYAVRMAYDAYVYKMPADSISQTPMYLPQALVPIGMMGLLLQLVSHLVRKVLPCSQTP